VKKSYVQSSTVRPCLGCERFFRCARSHCRAPPSFPSPSPPPLADPASSRQHKAAAKKELSRRSPPAKAAPNKKLAKKQRAKALSAEKAAAPQRKKRRTSEEVAADKAERVKDKAKKKADRDAQKAAKDRAEAEQHAKDLANRLWSPAIHTKFEAILKAVLPEGGPQQEGWAQVAAKLTAYAAVRTKKFKEDPKEYDARTCYDKYIYVRGTWCASSPPHFLFRILTLARAPAPSPSCPPPPPYPPADQGQGIPHGQVL
jgi:hypothetical protein